MIRIDKGPAPDILTTTGVERRDAVCALYEADRELYDSGKKRLSFDSKIYGHADVRQSLAASHHGKCAFCEVVIPRPYADPNVEHWRPKGSVKQRRGDALLTPGYYWLAYSWDNLLLACLFCNRDNKGSQFPLQDPSVRVRHPSENLSLETPELIKPDSEDPADHIEFLEELPRGITDRGKATVAVLGLARLEHKARDERYTSLREAYDLIVKYSDDPHPAAQELVASSRAFLAQAPQPSSPFSAMAAAFVARHPLPNPA